MAFAPNRARVSDVTDGSDLRFRLGIASASMAPNQPSLDAGPLLLKGVQLFDDNGALINTFQKSIDMRLKDPTLAAQVPSGIQVNAAFDLKSGKYVVRFIIREADGQSVTARNVSVNIP